MILNLTNPQIYSFVVVRFLQKMISKLMVQVVALLLPILGDNV